MSNRDEDKKPERPHTAPVSRTDRGGARVGICDRSLQAAPAKERPVKKVTTRVLGANDRINLAFIGNGMQFLGLAGSRLSGRARTRRATSNTRPCATSGNRG